MAVTTQPLHNIVILDPAFQYCLFICNCMYILTKACLRTVLYTSIYIYDLLGLKDSFFGINGNVAFDRDLLDMKKKL